MSFNGAGVFVRLYSWVNDAAANIKIRADRMDNEMNGMATGLSTCITKDGQTTITANLPMANFRHTSVADAVNKQEYYTLNQAMNGTGTRAAIVGGTANAITLGFSPTFTSYTTPMRLSFIATTPNTAAVTVAIDALPIKALTKSGATPLVLGDILAGVVYIIEYDGTQVQLLNPSTSYIAPSGGTFTGTVTMSGAAFNEAKGADIASAATTNIGAATGNYVNVTGTTTITAFDTVQAGTRRIVNFTGILTLTYNATSLILPTLASITTAAGDTATFVSLGAGNWKCVEYQRASGASLIPSAFTTLFESAEQAIATSTNVSVAHGLPSLPKLIQIVIRCKIAEQNYSIGDEVEYSSFKDSSTFGVDPWVNTTNIGLAVAGSNPPSLINKTANTGFSITAANWRWVLRAWV